MPSSSEVRARQPSLARRLTSSSLRGVPSGREGSKLIPPVYPTAAATTRANSAMVMSSPVPILTSSVAGIGLHQVNAGVRHDRRHRGIPAAACRCPRPPRWKRRSLRFVKPADQRCDDVAVFGVIIVAGPVQIGRHHIDEVGAILAAIGFDHLDAGDLGDRIGLVGRLQRSGQHGILAQRLRRKPWDRCRTSRETSAFRRR